MLLVLRVDLSFACLCLFVSGDSRTPIVAGRVVSAPETGIPFHPNPVRPCPSCVRAKSDRLFWGRGSSASGAAAPVLNQWCMLRLGVAVAQGARLTINCPVVATQHCIHAFYGGAESVSPSPRCVINPIPPRGLCPVLDC